MDPPQSDQCDAGTVEQRLDTAVVLYALAMIAVIVGVDVLFFRHPATNAIRSARAQSSRSLRGCRETSSHALVVRC
jgi:hypothetical protein